MYLYGAKLRECAYKTGSPGHMEDHEHCVLCGATFSEREGDLSNGLVDGNSVWICFDCYEEYIGRYGFTLCRDG